MTDTGLSSLLERAARAAVLSVDAEPDVAYERILDAAVLQAAAVGLGRLTMEDVVRASGLGRMTVYRRFPRRDELVSALVLRETQRFLAAVAAGIASSATPADGVVEAFVAAVRFAREHPMLRRVAQPGAVQGSPRPDDAELLALGSAFIARQIHGERSGRPGREARWVAEVFARLFVSFLLVPPADPSFDDEDELRAFARDILTPMVQRVSPEQS